MDPLFKGGFLVLFAFLLAVSEATRGALRCVPENNLECTGAAVTHPGKAKVGIFAVTS